MTAVLSEGQGMDNLHPQRPEVGDLVSALVKDTVTEGHRFVYGNVTRFDQDGEIMYVRDSDSGEECACDPTHELKIIRKHHTEDPQHIGKILKETTAGKNHLLGK